MIAIGCDHGGYRLKEQIKAYFDKRDIEYYDYGCYSEESADYPVYAVKVTEAIVKEEAGCGILFCTTGIGISMAANKAKGIRAAVCTNEYCAEMTRRHNDANVLCLGAAVVSEAEALKITEIFLNTEFEGGKHLRRVQQIAQIEEGVNLS